LEHFKQQGKLEKEHALELIHKAKALFKAEPNTLQNIKPPVYIVGDVHGQFYVRFFTFLLFFCLPWLIFNGVSFRMWLHFSICVLLRGMEVNVRHRGKVHFLRATADSFLRAIFGRLCRQRIFQVFSNIFSSAVHPPKLT
jgi:hypothetical protein